MGTELLVDGQGEKEGKSEAALRALFHMRKPVPYTELWDAELGGAPVLRVEVKDFAREDKQVRGGAESREIAGEIKSQFEQFVRIVGSRLTSDSLSRAARALLSEMYRGSFKTKRLRTFVEFVGRATNIPELMVRLELSASSFWPDPAHRAEMMLQRLRGSSSSVKRRGTPLSSISERRCVMSNLARFE